MGNGKKINMSAFRNTVKKIIPEKILRMWRNRDFNPDDYYMLPKKAVTYHQDLLYTFHNADFQYEKKFAEAYALVKQLGGKLLENYDIQWRVHVLCFAAKYASKLQGDFVDCGVYTGFCPRAIIHYTDFNSLGKTYWLFDTFGGMDSRFSSDYEMQRDNKLGYKESGNLYEQVKKTFEPFNAKLVKGAIPETLSQATMEKISFLSIDMNSVQPEVAALEFFWDKLVPGGIIVLDDYGYPGCIEQKHAHDKFAASKGTEVLSLPTCQGIILKS
jgi:O-methyltransferase